MKKVFICYRRAAAQYPAGALGRGLRDRFGEEQVFRDREDMEGGAPWREQVQDTITSQSTILVMIDREWAAPGQPGGRRRLDDPADPIRMELRDALADGATVIPVLLESAEMPDEAHLPPDIRAVARIHALPLRDADWPHDFQRICQRLERSGLRPRAATSGLPGLPAAPGRGASIKLIASLVLGGLALLTLGADELDKDAYGGIALFAGVALLLAGFAYHDYRRGRAQRLWPIASAMVVSGVGLLLGVAGGGGTPTAPAAPAPALANVAAGPGAAVNVPSGGGVWKNVANALPFTFGQSGASLYVTTQSEQGKLQGSGVLSGRQAEVTLTMEGIQVGRMTLGLSEDGRAMSGTVTTVAGQVQPIAFTRQP